MKHTTIGALAGAVLHIGSASAAVLADFTGSASTTSGTVIDGAPTTAANLTNGTTGGTWSNLTTAPGNGSNSGAEVSDATANAMNGNWLLLGMAGNGTTHLTSARLTLTDDLTLNGATFDLSLNMRNSGGQDGGLVITGYDSLGNSLFSFSGGNGGAYGQKDLSTYTSTPTVDNTITDGWNLNGDGADVSLSFATNTYTLTTSNSNNNTSIEGNVFGAGDLSYIVFDATGSKALWGIDNITTAAVPEPSSTALLGLGGIALILRRRR